jgi:hypothetical protein
VTQRAPRPKRRPQHAGPKTPHGSQAWQRTRLDTESHWPQGAGYPTSDDLHRGAELERELRGE